MVEQENGGMTKVVVVKWKWNIAVVMVEVVERDQ